MHTYKLGGMIITDELYHDDLDSMTFGRKDQNELYHYGIKGQSWGKRRFQNEDGSLTNAGRNRYDVGAPLSGANVAKTNSGTGSRSGGTGSFNKTSAVNRQTFASSNRPSGGRMTNVARTDSGTGNRAGGFSAARNAITASSSQSVKNSANSGRKAADNLFSRISNAATGAVNSAKQWGNQAAQDVANTATNAYNGARDLAGQAVDAVKDKAQDVAYDIQSLANTPEARDIANGVNSAIDKAKELGGQVSGAAQNAYNGAREIAGQAVDAARNIPQNISDWYTGDKAGREAQRYDNVVQNFERNGERNVNEGNDTIAKGINIENKYPNVSDRLVNEGFKQLDLGYDQHDVAKQYGQKADEAQARYDNAPRQKINNALGAVGDWVGDRAQDVAGAAQNAYNGAREIAGQAVDAARNIPQNISDWYTGDKAGQEAQRYDNVVRNFERNGERNVNEGADRMSNAMNEDQFWSGNGQRNLGYRQHDLASQYGQKADEAQARYDTAPRQKINNALNIVGDRARELAGQAGQAASNAASSVRDWGAGAVDKGRQAFENLFGRSEPPVPTLLDPNPQIETETILRENIIPEQRITEQRIPEQRITEQRIPEQRITENRPTMSGSNNVQTWDNASVNGWDNVRTFGDPEMAEIARQFANQQNSQNQRLQAENAQYEQRRKELLSDKPNNVSDEYWEAYKSNGGTKESYDREMEARKNSQNDRASSNNSSMSDKPDGVSDEYWRDYTSNGGTRESYDRQMEARKNSQYNGHSAVSLNSPVDYNALQERLRAIADQQTKNGYRVEEVQAPVGTVDTSRPYHFTFDPNSGQTIVVYDDEKKR